MFTSPERKPSVSNWFSSLRRQPKPKKPINNGKRLQKSCVDLSTVVTTPANTSIVDSSAIACEQSPPPPPPSSGAATAIMPPKTLTLVTHIGGVDGDNGTGGGGISKTINFDKLSIIATATSPTKISKTNTIAIDQIKKISTTTTSSSANSASTVAKVAAAAATAAELKITTTTKVTSTTVVTKQIHRVGLVFNENGELISNLESFRNFANNLNTKLLSMTSPSDNNNDSKGNVYLLDGDDIEYIDDTTTTTTAATTVASTSQSDIRHKDTMKSTVTTAGKSACVTCNSGSGGSSSNNKGKSKTDTNSRAKKVFFYTILFNILNVFVAYICVVVSLQ